MSRARAEVRVGAVAYHPRIVTIWERFLEHFDREGVPTDYILYSNYERLVDAALAGDVEIAWNTNTAFVALERRKGAQARILGMRDVDGEFATVILTRRGERFSIDPCVLHVHASQLYEGFLEGLVVFAILWIYTAKPRPRLAPAGLFLLCYGVFRFAVEFVRVPDENRGYLLFDWVTMGQILSTPMIVAGLIMLIVAYRRNDPTGNVGGSR